MSSGNAGSHLFLLDSFHCSLCSSFSMCCLHSEINPKDWALGAERGKKNSYWSGFISQLQPRSYTRLLPTLNLYAALRYGAGTQQRTFLRFFCLLVSFQLPWMGGPRGALEGNRRGKRNFFPFPQLPFHHSSSWGKWLQLPASFWTPPFPSWSSLEKPAATRTRTCSLSGWTNHCSFFLEFFFF